MSRQSLEDLLQAAGNPVNMLRNSQIGAYVYPVVPSEYTNWRDEQRAWQEACVLFDQAHHMVEQLVEGPEAFKLFSSLAANSFAQFPIGRAKQFFPCSHGGHVIGDGILFRLDENTLNFVGRAPAANWVQFHAESGVFDVMTSKDDRSPSITGGRAVIRNHYRFQIQGPNAMKVLEKLNGGPFPEVKFFHLGTINIAGRRVRCLRHGMAGAPGLEVWGPYAQGEEMRGVILEAGREFGMKVVGARAYATNTLESGWIPSPLPGIYTGEKMKPYRQWLPATSYEGTGSLGGSFVSSNIENYYLTPYELGYGPFVKFDHDFVGREALEKVAGKPHRKKVTFAWHADDVAKVFRSLLEPGVEHFKYIDLPLSNFASSSYDSVLRGGKVVGISMFGGYSYNERSMLSLGVVDPDVELGTEVKILWGEEGGGTQKTTVERHKQLEIRAVVSSAPYSTMARTTYASGWRNQQ